MIYRKNTVTRKGKFDAGHRVMNERFKCFNIHGHEYHYELNFSYLEAEDIGYAIDFKEIKRIGCAWIDDALDHGFIANPQDEVCINACRELGSKLFIMHLNGDEYCNPTAENIVKEIFFAISKLLNQKTDGGKEEFNLKLDSVRLYETVNCFVDCHGLSESEWDRLEKSDFSLQLDHYKNMKGILEYDDRKAKEADSN